MEQTTAGLIEKISKLPLRTNQNIGSSAGGITKTIEYGDGFNHTTVLTIKQLAAITLADVASIADGSLIYTLPAGNLVVNSAYMSLLVTNAEHDTEATDIGLGTTIATGAVAVLGGTAGFENILTGQTGAVGTATEGADSTSLVILAADPHIVHINVAGAWADTAGAALDADLIGTVVLNWSFLG